MREMPFSRNRKDSPEEACGVFGVFAPGEDVGKVTYFGLYALQHRGQESAGIAVTSGDGILVVKDLGLVSQVFTENSFENLKGNCGLGHVRYSTTGSTQWENSQPLYQMTDCGPVAIAHNGNLVNTIELRTALEGMGAGFATTSDTEVMGALLATSGADTIEGAIEETFPRLKGAYSVCVLTEEGIIGVRDPNGIRPLCIGKRNGGAVIASETADLGQYVGIGQALATAYGIDAFEIEVPLEDRDLAWFEILQGSEALGSKAGQADRVTARVYADFAGREHVWMGHVTRTTGQVDPLSRMVPVVIEVPKPLDTSEGKPPLLPGAFVKVLIAGRMLENAVAVPRDAIRGQNSIWLVNNDRLHVTELDIVRTDREFAYVTSGLPEQATIITSALDAVVDGMTVRLPDGAGSEETGDREIPTGGVVGDE